MSVQRSRPRRPAWLYPAGSILTLRDGREFIVDEQEIQIYDEFGIVGDPDDYIYSKFRKYWRRVK